MAFGQAQRTAAQDANEGVVNPPAKQHVARTTTPTRTREQSSLDLGLEAVGNTIGAGLQQFMDTESSNLREKQMLEGATRQGTDLAINQIDADKKRNGIGAAFFGQNASQRGAQQRAVANNINKNYLELSYAMDTHADKTPEEFNKVLTESLDNMLEPFAGDRDTKYMIGKEWAGVSQKLTAAHYKANFGYVQIENEKEARQKMRGDADTLQLDFNNLPRDDAGNVIVGPEYKELLGRARNSFKYEHDAADTQSKADWTKMKNEEINYALKNGNVDLYQMAVQFGWDKDLSPEDAVKRDSAVGTYDADEMTKGNTLYQQTLGYINDPSTQSVEQFEAYLETYQDQLDVMEQKSSGSMAGQLNVETLRNRFLSLQKAAGEAAVKAEAKRLQVEEGFRAIDQIRNGDGTGVGTWSGIEKTKDKQDILDAYIVDQYNRGMPAGEELAPGDVMNAILDNPAYAKTTAETLNSMDVTSPLFKSAALTAVNSAWNMEDTQDGSPTYGQFTKQAKLRIKSLTQFENVPGFSDILGDEGLIKYEMLKQAMEMNQSVEESSRETALLIENRKDRTTYGAKTFDSEGKTINTREHLTALLSNLQGGEVAAQTLSEYTTTFADGMAIYKGDVKAADNYVIRKHSTNTIHVQGRTIANGQELNKMTTGTMSYNVTENGLTRTVTEQVEMSFQDVIKGMQAQNVNSRTEPTLMTGILAGMLGPKGEKMYTLDDVPGWTMERDYLTGGVILTVPGAPMHRTLTPEDLSRYTVEVSQLNRIHKNARRIEAYNRGIGQQQTYNYLSGPTKTPIAGTGGLLGGSALAAGAVGQQALDIIHQARRDAATALSRHATGDEIINRDRNSVFTKQGVQEAVDVTRTLQQAGIPDSAIEFTSNERGTPEATWANITANGIGTYGRWDDGSKAEYRKLYKAYNDADAKDKPAKKKELLDYYQRRSKHATGKGLDLSISNMTQAQQATTMDTLRANGYHVVDETGNKTGPHIHFEWD